MCTNLTAFIKSIPSLAVQRYVTMCVLGSCNARIVGRADTIARKLLDAYGDEFKSLDAREAIAATAGPQTGPQGPLVEEGRLLYRMHVEWRNLMLHATEVATGAKDDAFGTIASTIELMTSTPKMRDVDSEGLNQLKALGLSFSEDEVNSARAAQYLRDKTMATDRAARQGAIEWVIDHLFASTDESDDVFVELSDELKAMFVDKAIVAFGKAQNIAAQNLLFKQTSQNLFAGDYMLCKDAVSSLNGTAVVEPPKPAVRRVRKNVTA